MSRTDPRQLLKALLAAVVLLVCVVAATRPVAPDAPPPPRPPAASADTLTARYQSVHHYLLTAARTAHRAGDPGRARSLERLAAGGRTFWSADARGDGQAVEVLGDLAGADRIAVLVPGSDTTLDSFDHLGSPNASLHSGALALRAQAHRLAPRTHLAVVAWYGYRAPHTISSDVMSTARADEGAPRLDRLLTQLHAVNPAAPTTLLCHSYGTVVCGAALHTARPAVTAALHAVALYGSPGTGVESAADLAPGVAVWAGRAANDWIARVPHVHLDLLGRQWGFGPDPTSPAYGAHRFAAGDGSHSDYLHPGPALRNLTLLTLGRTPQTAR
ncbi:alpha/beta hydrolase [Streptomyces sp. NPDC059740]|uniref:alpha/beta hydrolase n=1 Tax=Streptomyces sp. NPDC059740 TaxID=3346926 RepID=UPI00364A52F6